tara:strand:+ start:72 stop:230 length:159 start_codon:yes stop_codon:yes gene_type:complete
MTKKGNAVAISHDVDLLLKEVVIARKKKGSLIKNKVDVVADLIIKTHKKECK